jgi:hypothetical protein
VAYVLGVIAGFGQSGCDLVARFQRISKLRDMVNNLDGIKQWIEKRPKTSF